MDPYINNSYNYGMGDFSYPGAYGSTNNYAQILEELQSGDEMRIYSAILELSQTLSLAQENTMNSFSIDAYVEAINTIINSPTYSDISSEITFHSILSLINIMDIFPNAVNTIINKTNENGSVIGALSEKIQNLQYIDVAEKAIKALERISSESAISVLANASLDTILNMADFFELDTQILILKMISNV
jgi:E3 ubiquitin-protein ligase TRIP12